MAYRRSSPSAEDAAAGFAGGTLAILAALMIISAYFVVRTCWMVIRTFARHPTNRALWSALGLCLGAWALLGLALVVSGGCTQQAVPVLSALLALAGLSAAGLAVTAKVVELREDHLFQRAFTKETLVQEVLQRPWWEAA
ncbi:MAG TPA: hypothetical protein VGF38_09185 [Ktedonobacterales bacterium]|jgi:hypothetical protein